jgi:hypothetical protein
LLLAVALVGLLLQVVGALADCFKVLLLYQTGKHFWLLLAVVALVLLVQKETQDQIRCLVLLHLPEAAVERLHTMEQLLQMPEVAVQVAVRQHTILAAQFMPSVKGFPDKETLVELFCKEQPVLDKA